MRLGKGAKLVDVGLWALAAFALMVAAALAGARLSPVLDVIGQVAVPALSLAVIGAALALLLRRWKPLIGFGAATALLALLLLPQWRPPLPRPSPQAQVTRVYFDNIYWKNRDIAAAAASVAKVSPDVVAMAEFSDAQAPGTEQILKGLPHRVFAWANPRFRGHPRAVIASRYPVTPLGRAYDGPYESLAARIHAPGGDFRLVVIHLTRPWPFRRKGELARQLDVLAQGVGSQPTEPTVIVGDFNATASGALLSRFRQRTGFASAPAVAGDWPANLPAPFRIAIENAFVGHGLTVVSRRLGPFSGSDHRPIVVEVARGS
ncbi:MAG: endonuclease/exonuclease/phosphatase family protein [Proteobacteria bacterium]|nr:endonuclease/exonuclease/phosphatase family protein [Pseudomonadota bacterium]